MPILASRRTFLKASLAATGLFAVRLRNPPPSLRQPQPASGIEVEALLYIGYPLDEARIEAFGLFKRIAPDLDIEAIEIASAWDDMQVQVGAVLASGNRIDLLPIATHGLPRLWGQFGPVAWICIPGLRMH